MKRVLMSLSIIGIFALTLLPVPTKVRGQSGINTGQWYHIIAKHSGMCLDVLGGSRADGAQLVQSNCHFGDNQTFRFDSVGGGYYRIVTGHIGKCIDQQGANFTDGGLFVQYFCHTGQNQQFLPNPGQVGTGFYNQIPVRHSGKNMDVLNFSYTNGAQIVQYIPHGADNQQFELRPAATPCAGRDADADGYNACVDCNDNNASVNPGAEPNCNGSGDQNCNGIADFRECEQCEFCLDPSGRE